MIGPLCTTVKSKPQLFIQSSSFTYLIVTLIPYLFKRWSLCTLSMQLPCTHFARYNSGGTDPQMNEIYGGMRFPSRWQRRKVLDISDSEIVPEAFRFIQTQLQAASSPYPNNQTLISAISPASINCLRELPNDSVDSRNMG